jgi:hypothetical protein
MRDIFGHKQDLRETCFMMNLMKFSPNILTLMKSQNMSWAEHQEWVKDIKF